MFQKTICILLMRLLTNRFLHFYLLYILIAIGYKNITDIWVFEWQNENRKYTNIPYAPHLECVQCLDDGLQAQIPDIDKSEIEVFALSDDEDHYLTTDLISSINHIDNKLPKTIYYIVVPCGWYDYLRKN